MSYLQIPVRSDIPAYEFQIELEQQLYFLLFSYNDREGRWFLDILDSLQSPIVRGIKLLTGWPVVSRFQDTRLPPGEFFMLDTAGQNKDAGRDDLGTRVLMIYRESGTVDE